jgi:hypothetical protein
MIPPVLRRLFTIASAASLVLCVATCVLWVRSYWVADDLDHVDKARADHRAVFTARSFDGLLRLPWGTDYRRPDRAVWRAEYERELDENEPGGGSGWRATSTHSSMLPSAGAVLTALRRFEYESYDRPAPTGDQDDVRHTGGHVCVPYWTVAALFALGPSVAGARHWRTRLRRPARLVPVVRVRPPRHARPVPGVREGAGGWRADMMRAT